MSWLLDPFMHWHLQVGGRLLSSRYSCGWVFHFLPTPPLPVEVGRDHWKPVLATTGGPSICLVIGGRLVVCYLYG